MPSGVENNVNYPLYGERQGQEPRALYDGRDQQPGDGGGYQQIINENLNDETNGYYNNYDNINQPSADAAMLNYNNVDYYNNVGAPVGNVYDQYPTTMDDEGQDNVFDKTSHLEEGSVVHAPHFKTLLTEDNRQDYMTYDNIHNDINAIHTGGQDSNQGLSSNTHGMMNIGLGWASANSN